MDNLGKEENKVKIFREINISSIFPDPEQPRKEFEIESLAKSIQKNGVIPIEVIQDNGGYKIIDGERRWRACKLLQYEKINCFIKEIKKEEVLTRQLVFDVHKKHFSHLEKSEAIKKLKEQKNLSNEEVSKILNIDSSAVRYYLRIADLPAELKEYIKQGVNAREILKKYSESEKKRLKELEPATNCMYCGSPNLTKKNVARLKDGIRQLYYCKDCKKTFVWEFIEVFNNTSLTEALENYEENMFKKGREDEEKVTLHPLLKNRLEETALLLQKRGLIINAKTDLKEIISKTILINLLKKQKRQVTLFWFNKVGFYYRYKIYLFKFTNDTLEDEKNIEKVFEINTQEVPNEIIEAENYLSDMYNNQGVK